MFLLLALFLLQDKRATITGNSTDSLMTPEEDGRSNCKQGYWDELFETMVAADPHHRELSIHNGQYYNHSQPWISHISMQCHDASCVDLAKKNWTAKPIVMDEVRYEGNISTGALACTHKVSVSVASAPSAHAHSLR